MQVKPHTLVRLCDECNYGSFEGRCTICGCGTPRHTRKRAVQQWLIRLRSRVAIGTGVRGDSGKGVSDAYYCKECVMLEKDRDGCPKIINIGQARSDLFYARKAYNFQSR